MRKFNISMRKFIHKAHIVIGIICLLYFGVLYLYGGIWISMVKVWPIVGVSLIALGICGLACSSVKGLPSAIISFFDCIVVTVFVSVMAFVGCAAADMISSPPYDCDVLIVLGAAVVGDKPSEVLEHRIDAAYEYLEAHPDTRVVCTGGMGYSDKISEGKCIADSLEQKGISPDRILYEESSTTTVENIKEALAIAGDFDRVTVISSGFHLFRAKLITRNYTDAQVFVASASGVNIYTPHYLVREYIVLAYDIIRGTYSILP